MGFSGAYVVGEWAAIVPGIFGLLGLFWIYRGCLSLVARRQQVITISESGIEFPALAFTEEEPTSIFIPHNEIKIISKNESVKGRFIEILLKDGNSALINARTYCPLEDFLYYCEDCGLPVD